MNSCRYSLRIVAGILLLTSVPVVLANPRFGGRESAAIRRFGRGGSGDSYLRPGDRDPGDAAVLPPGPGDDEEPPEAEGPDEAEDADPYVDLSGTGPVGLLRRGPAPAVPQVGGRVRPARPGLRSQDTEPGLPPPVEETPEIPPPGPPPEENLFSWDFLHLLWADTAHVVSAPARWDATDWTTAALSTAGVGGMTALDGVIQTGVRRVRTRAADAAAKIVEPMGSYGSVGVLGAFYLAGTVGGDERARSTAIDGLSASFITSILFVPAIKTTIGRARPSAGDGPYEYSAFNLNDTRHSFPSGHTAQAFAVASVIATHYDPVWVKVAAYGTASLVGLARIEQDRHFASDVLAGALLGTAIGRTVASFNEEGRTEERRRRVTVGPVTDADLRGLAVDIEF